MVRKITYAIYVQNSIFLSSLKTEKIISSFFDIAYLCIYCLFRYLRFSISSYNNKQPEDSKLKFARQECFIIQTDDARSRI